MFFPPEIKRVIFRKDTPALSISKAGLGSCAYLALRYLKEGQNVAVFFPDPSSLTNFSALGKIFLKEKENFWENNWIHLPSCSPSHLTTHIWANTWASLFTLGEGSRPLVLFTTIENLLVLWPPKEAISSSFLYLSPMDEMDPEAIMNQLINWGYERVKLTTLPGEISRRGDILDVYPPGYNQPIRLEFFGDIIESIRTFNPSTQRSQKDLSECLILPINLCVIDQKYPEEAKDIWEHLWKTGEISKSSLLKLKTALEQGKVPPYPGLYYKRALSLDKCLPQDTIFFIVEPEICRRRLKEKEEEWIGYLKAWGEETGIVLPANKIILSASIAKRNWVEKKNILFDSLSTAMSSSISLPETTYYSHSDLFWKPEEKKRPLHSLIQKLKEWERTKNQVILSFNSKKSKERFLSLIKNNEDSYPISIKEKFSLTHRGIFLSLSPLSTGFSLQWNNILILPENVFLPKQEKGISRNKSLPKFKGIIDIEEINPEDLLVHREYGIGKFRGLRRLTTEGIANDYLEIEYAEGDTLFVPVDRLNLVQKYKGPEGITPPLDKLGSTRWNTTKSRVKKAIEQIAQDLVEMYAYRKVAKGFSYPPIDEDFREFEASFPYEETPDQEQAIYDVLRDMEREIPMDRLVCGDAGFGKTEIAMRAAYRAVSAGRQVVLLCPTTVLAEQHFRNFKGRMEPFGITVQMLSRFVPRGEQQQIVKDLKKGIVDIIIGTHRLLSKDIVIPRLGLIILDEEQRFGVRQKERLKEIRKNVDVLALSATPIPRTLQLSLTGIRELSVIETPPEDRKPVETSIIERNRKKIKEIIERELQRGGQVFWVYNRVRGLESRKNFLSSLLPSAKVAMAHGQMKEKQLEDTLHSFLLGEIDVLVCTSIIESGLDFPRANTLIVDNPQLFGLGQLYQLRGRVGRSDKQAYAYFVVENIDKLSPKVIKRLKTILDMDYLGAGFKVAMEDLKLRGAGNLLGEAQTGNMAKVGIDLYMDMLEKEVKKLKGEKIEDEVEPQLNIFVASSIPEEYIEDTLERMRYYKGMSSSKERKELNMWREDLEDRFGPLPLEVENLLSILEFKHILVKLGADRADIYENRILIYWDTHPIKVAPHKVMKWVTEHKKELRLIGPKRIEISLREEFSRALHTWIKELESLIAKEEEFLDESSAA